MSRFGVLLLIMLSMLASCRFNSVDGHRYVDLGLPSGTLWATCNVGADSPMEYGEYLAWGEIKPQADNSYSLDSYKYLENNKLKHYTNALSVLLPSDDAATANWGKAWKTPSVVQWEELRDCCKWALKDNGCLVIGPNGKGIFLPAQGCRSCGELNGVGENGYYWSNTIDKDNPFVALYFCFSSVEYDVQSFYFRNTGFAVRPVVAREK